MSYLILIAFLLLATFAGVLCWITVRQKAALEAALARDAEHYQDREPEMLLTLKVVDPLMVAKRESRSARVVADRLPVMVTKMVYQRVMEELEQELLERDIKVDMTIEYR